MKYLLEKQWGSGDSYKEGEIFDFLSIRVFILGFYYKEGIFGH